jgi:hypothetical protein
VLPRAATPLAALLLCWATLALLALAFLLLLWNVRPRLRGSGFVAYESMTDAEPVSQVPALAGEFWSTTRVLPRAPRSAMR